MAILKVNNLEVNYGLIKAVKGVSFEVNQGEIVSLIGANGAGKTTIMHAISGLLPTSGGSIEYCGKDLAKVSADKIVALGLTQVPEGRRIFQELTVKDNLMLGAFLRKDTKGIKDTLDYVYTLFPRLKERVGQIAGTLSGGEQQMLAVGRALMCKPKMLLLDEPSMGLSPLFVNIIFDTIKQVNQNGTTILLVEQNARKALQIADRAYVIETGKITLSGKGDELLNNDEVKKAYLGE